MLIQSHAGFIELLPAIPDSWKTSGEVKGLRARGNYTVNMRWKAGLITDYHIFPAQKRTIKVKINGIMKQITTEKV